MAQTYVVTGDTARYCLNRPYNKELRPYTGQSKLQKYFEKVSYKHLKESAKLCMIIVTTLLIQHKVYDPTTHRTLTCENKQKALLQWSDLLASCTLRKDKTSHAWRSGAPCYMQAWQRHLTLFWFITANWSTIPGLMHFLSQTSENRKMFRNSYQCKRDCGTSHFGNHGIHDCGAPGNTYI